MYVVAYCFEVDTGVYGEGDSYDAEDHYERFDDLAEAKARYAELLGVENLHSASLCWELDSTDDTGATGDAGLPEPYLSLLERTLGKQA